MCSFPVICEKYWFVRDWLLEDSFVGWDIDTSSRQSIGQLWREILNIERAGVFNSPSDSWEGSSWEIGRARAILEEVVKGLVVLECFKFMKETDWWQNKCLQKCLLGTKFNRHGVEVRSYTYTVTIELQLSQCMHTLWSTTETLCAISHCMASHLHARVFIKYRGRTVPKILSCVYGVWVHHATPHPTTDNQAQSFDSEVVQSDDLARPILRAILCVCLSLFACLCTCICVHVAHTRNRWPTLNLHIVNAHSRSQERPANPSLTSNVQTRRTAPPPPSFSLG